MTKTLDRSRPYGTVHPPFEGMHFEQDGYPFDHEGRLVEKLLKPEQKQALEKKAAARAAKAPPASGGETGAPNGESPSKPTEPAAEGAGDGNKSDEADDDGINLEQWLRDPATANFKDVRVAIKERYSVWHTAKDGAVDFLVNEVKLLPVEEIDASLRDLLVRREQAAQG